MFQIAALPTAATAPAGPDGTARAAVEPGQSGDFASFLAKAEPNSPDAAPAADLPAQNPTLAAIGKAAMQPGKILPASLADFADLPGADAPDPAELALPARQALIPTLSAALRKGAATGAPGQPDAADGAGAEQANLPGEADAQAQPDAAPAPAFLTEPAMLMALIPGVPGEAAPVATPTGSPAGGAPTLPTAQLALTGLQQGMAQTLADQSAGAAQSNREGGRADRAGEVRLVPVASALSSSAPSAVTAAPFTLVDGPAVHAAGPMVQLRPDLSLASAGAAQSGPSAAIARALKGEDEAGGDLGGASLLDAAVAPFAPATGRDDLGAAVGTPAPATRPAAAATTHDFAAVVDRLIAARDMVQPHAVNLSIDHADFGKVSLAFRQDDGGLSVAVSSADPAFARAVQAAAPAMDTSAGSGSNAGNNAQAAFAATRGDAGSADGRGASGQGQQRDNPARATTREPSANLSDRTGQGSNASGRDRFA